MIICNSLLSGCIAKSNLDISMKNSPSNKDKQLGILSLSVAAVKIQNNQLIVSGTNLAGITQLKLIKDGVAQNFNVESSTNNEVIANGISTVSLGIGQVFEMILSTANAAATVPVLFSLSNKSVTSSMLANMGALSGQILKFNGSSWAPASLIDAQLYKGTWSPAGLLPDVSLSSPGDYWVVSASGINAGDGNIYAIGDWIISDGYTWSKLALSKTSVTSFNGRKGLVNLVPGDYSNLKSGTKIPGSNLNDLSNVDITTVAPTVGDVLKFNGTNWVAGAGGAGGANSVGSAEITDLSITGADIADNTINPIKIYSSSINSALYLRGDKTWANFAADVLNVPLSTYTLDATVKPTVGVTDKIGAALGKIQKYLNDLNSDYISRTATSQVVSGTFSFTSPTSFLYTQLPTGVSPTEVTNVQYVQNYVSSALSGVGAYAPGTLTTALAATSTDSTITVGSTSGYPPSGTLLIGSEAIIYSGKTATTFTGLTRGSFGSTAAIISNGEIVNNYVLTGKSTNTTTPSMVVTGANNVGIGTLTPNSTLQVSGSIAGNVVTKTSNYSLGPDNYIILADATSAAVTLTLPTASAIIGRLYTIKKIDSSSNQVIIATTGAQTVDGQSSPGLTSQYQYVTVVSDGNNWSIINSNGVGPSLPAGCGGHSASITGQTVTTITVSPGCPVTFKVWGAGGGGGYDDRGGGGGFTSVTVTPGSLTTYYLSVGAAGAYSSPTTSGGLTGFVGGPGYGASGSGGSASGVWTGSYGGTPVAISGGGAGGSRYTFGFPGGSGVFSTTGNGEAGGTANDCAGGAGGGYHGGTGGANGTSHSYGGENYVVSGGVTAVGSAFTPANSTDINYPANAGVGGGNRSGSGGSGAIYYSW